MIDIISPQDLRRLAETVSDRCISIYLPTHRAGNDGVQDPIRLKNLLAQTKRELTDLGSGAQETSRLLAAPAPLLNDHDFWTHLEEGLAVFITPDECWVYRLPGEVDELVVIADHFHLKPLVPFVGGDDSFYVLAISQNQIRLLHAGQYRVSELALPGVPTSKAEALPFDDREAQLHSHGASRVGRGRVAASFHGQGGGRDARRADLERFLGMVDSGVRHIIGDGGAPLVLAGVESTVAVYRGISHYKDIVAEGIYGRPEALSESELRQRAWPLVADRFDRIRREAAQAVMEESVPSVHTVTEAVAAARDGRVAAVFVPLGTQQWGTIDADTGRVVEHDEHLPGDRDLLDLIAVEAITHGGRVFAGEVPGGGPVAASLRY